MDRSGSGDQARQVARKLREMIIAGRYAPGEPLRQDVIAEQLGTSRMPVREALRVLETEGLVLLVPNKGASVAPLDPREVGEIYEMRVAAETLALRLAIPELSNARIDRAARLQESVEAGDLAAFGRLNKAFHMTLYEACGRPRLLAHVAGLNDLSDRYLRLAIRALDYDKRSNDEHRALLDACRRRDKPAALNLLEQHITVAGQALQDWLETACS
ncbi:GntR family transcriptional regulator [Oceanibacterium hippocampi]|uniref:HTH-type transcriptional repressor CsiR n=1 Tax=Oceanibacterium hippocampi TaxID=745714 RepID=A0A1Y5SEE9_9PROT|nr:GntR family transcriptional regulator [Oceanibacterium hippocampi]SLN38840.1 HTH-type transcriptional repressor CsiR [Oceanibacterium hippocampi]